MAAVPGLILAIGCIPLDTQTMEPIVHRYGQSRVEIHATPELLGQAGARLLAEYIAEAVDSRGEARIIMATGNSQFPLTDALSRVDIPWPAVTVFHLDEYVGIKSDHPASFHRWIHERIEQPFRPKVVHYLDGLAEDLDEEIARYEGLLRQSPIDVVCMGIGENGHLAFNEPNDADFDTDALVSVIALQPESRQQQVNEGHFPTVDEVPSHALSLSVPALFMSSHQIVSVPERRKAGAVAASLTGPITEACPASILQERRSAVVLLEPESASELPG